MNKVPNLRFKEFSGDWGSKKIGEITIKVGSGKTPKGGNSVYTDEGIIFLRSQNVLNGKLSLDDVAYITEDINSTMKSTEVYPNDILLNITGASIGRSCCVPESFERANVNQHVCIIRLNKNYNSNFVMNQIISSRVQKQINSFQAGGNREGLNFEQIKGMKISSTTLEEQEKIASFFSLIDKKIELQTEKVEELKNYKKGIMQKIFSQELRFKDENGNEYPEWEISTIEKIANLEKGFTPDTKDEEGWIGDIPWLSIADMKQGKYVANVSKYISNKALGKKHLVPTGTLIMSFKLTIGRLAIVEEPLMTNEAICHFYWKNSNINTEYMYYYLNSVNVESFGCRAAKGITLNNDSLNSIVVKIPVIQEQKKISELLMSVDKKLKKNKKNWNV
ncbi:MAG: restriction endonuclease subunit S [Turicibacter sp.]